jgi:hypothetical protein
VPRAAWLRQKLSGRLGQEWATCALPAAATPRLRAAKSRLNVSARLTRTLHVPPVGC